MRSSSRGRVPRRVTGAAFAAVLLVGGTVSCGGGTAGEASPAAAVAEAAAHSERITSLRYRLTGTLPETGRLEAEASMATDPLVMGMKMDTTGRGGGGRLEVRFVDEVMYVGGSATDGERPDGKDWFRAEPAVWGSGAMDNRSYRVLPAQIEGDPAAQSRILTASQDVRRIGTETIDGVRTTRYRGTVTGRGISAARDAAADEAARDRQIGNLDQFMMLRVDGALTVDLWIGDDSHTKQFRLRGDSRGTRGGTDGRPLEIVDGEPFDLTLTFLDVNRPVTVEAPPFEDTAGMAATAGGAPSD